MNSTVTNQRIILICLSKFCNHRGEIYSEKHQWMLKVLGTSLRNRIFTYLSPHRFLTNYKEKNSPLYRNSKYSLHVPPGYNALRGTHWFFGISAKNAQSDSNHEKITDKFELRDILHNNWLTYFQSVKVTEEDKGIAPVRRLK